MLDGTIVVVATLMGGASVGLALRRLWRLARGTSTRDTLWFSGLAMVEAFGLCTLLFGVPVLLVGYALGGGDVLASMVVLYLVALFFLGVPAALVGASADVARVMLVKMGRGGVVHTKAVDRRAGSLSVAEPAVGTLSPPAEERS